VVALALTVAVAVTAGANAQATPLLGQNLVVNGGAEAGPGTPDAGSPPMPPPGWTVTSNFTAAQYGGSGGLPAPTDPGPPNRGRNFFAGGPSNPLSTAEQKIDVSAAATAIDTGAVKYRLAGYLGGYAGQEDHTVVTAAFRDASGAQMGAATIGPVTAADRHGVTGLFPRSTSGRVPPRTRWVDVVITATRYEGAYNDGYSDNISFYLTK